MRMIPYQYKIVIIPQLEPKKYTVQVKFCILRRIQEIVQKYCDMKWGNSNELIEKYLWGIIPVTITKDYIVTKYLMPYYKKIG